MTGRSPRGPALRDMADRVKDQADLKRLAEAAGVEWDARKSVAARSDWWGPCPFHFERSASFHVFRLGGRWAFKCFGCGVGGTAIDFVMERSGATFAEAVARLASEEGLEAAESPEARAKREAQVAARRAAREAQDAEDARLGLERAARVWTEANPPEPDGILARYLAARGVNLPAVGGIPASLRFAENLPCWEAGDDGRPAVVHRGPAMVARIGRGEFRGVHRTWITAEGRARFADGTKVPKKWLGPPGAMFGQPVRLASGAPQMLAGEGIETSLCALAAVRAAGDASWTAEAALSRDALAMEWVPPRSTARVMILGEGSSKDPATAREKTEAARDRLAALGLAVRFRVPGGRWDLDADYADLAAAKGLGAIHVE
ncbi:MAG: CHC2 zinc finger domain-containing protein [Pseudomonadota bacterium]